MKAPRITKKSTGYGLLLEDGKFAWASDGTHAAQNFVQRFLTNKGEYALNDGTKDYISNRADKGTKIYDVIFNMSLGRAEKHLEIMRVIRSTPGFKAMITPLEWTQTGNHMVITGAVQTEWGAVNIGETLELL